MIEEDSNRMDRIKGIDSSVHFFIESMRPMNH
jgi:hypothetical protein